MICKKCGCELNENAKFCNKCGTRVCVSDDKNLAMPVSESKNNTGSIIAKITADKSLLKIIKSILAAVLILAVFGVSYMYDNGGNTNSGIIKSDEELIIGYWKMDEEELDSWQNYSMKGIFSEITFYSDGTCEVNGTQGGEPGYWSIVNGKLKIYGSMGNLFWYYKSVAADYELSSNTLTIYHEDKNTIYTKAN